MIIYFDMNSDLFEVINLKGKGRKIILKFGCLKKEYRVRWLRNSKSGENHFSYF